MPSSAQDDPFPCTQFIQPQVSVVPSKTGEPDQCPSTWPASVFGSWGESWPRPVGTGKTLKIPSGSGEAEQPKCPGRGWWGQPGQLGELRGPCGG